MIKYLEVPDFHYDPAWADHSMACGVAVTSAARDGNVDFIAVPGDLFNRPLYASDRSRYGDLIRIVKSWLSVCPVVAIQGTPSHDGPGCYGPLEDVGLTLLRPGMMYVLRNLDDGNMSIDEDEADGSIPEAILFGIPEINTNQSTANDSEGRAGETITNLRRYLEEFIAPRRAMRPDIPAIGLLHGVVSDATRENESDIIKKQSSLLIHTEDLALAGLDRWSLGDIHTPWESQRISAGYAGFTGMDGNPWGKTGFVPAMNVVKIRGESLRSDAEENNMAGFVVDGPEITRLPYGSPNRVKITEPLESYHASVAYWLVSSTDDPSLNPALHGAHPWSRITFEKDRTETRRVTKEEAEKAVTLSDLARLMAPLEVTDTIAEKLDEIDTGRTSNAYGTSADLLNLKVVGCTFFHGKTAELNTADLPRALVELHGNDNGTGKSSLLCFATPYPLTVGRDTESGRPSAIHEFFTEKESYIEKTFQVGDEIHRHLLTIKGAHTQTKSVECYLYVSGENILATKSFDEMAQTCERLYGPLEDHLLTAFNVQPEQSKNVKSIAASTPTELRERVLRITGIDRSVESASALEKVRIGEAKAATLTARIEALSEFSSDPKECRERLYDAANEEQAACEVVDHIEVDKQREDQRVSDLALSSERSKAEARRKTENSERIESLQIQDRGDAQRRSGLEASIATRGDHEKALLEDDKQKVRIEERDAQDREIEEENRDERERFAREDRAYNEALNAITQMRSNRDGLLKMSSDRLESAKVIADPCENCGHISESNQATVEKYKTEAADYHTEAQLLDHKISNVRNPVGPRALDLIHVGDIREGIHILPIFERGAHQDAITEADKAQATIDELDKQRESRTAAIAELQAREYRVDPMAEEDHRKAVVMADAAASALSGARLKASTSSSSVATAKTALEAAEQAATKIKADQDESDRVAFKLADWKWVAAMMRPNKLPAFELDMILDEIDERATRYVKPFRSERYAIRTETQGVGKAGGVDRFRVLVHDGETGEEKSLLKFSGGEKVFLADAYQKALLDVRKERRGVLHEPVVFDETDGAIRPERIAEYYQMQTDYFVGVRTLVVSHAPDAQNYIQNQIDMTEVLG